MIRDAVQAGGVEPEVRVTSSLTTLRTMSPQPTSNTREPAISNAINPLRRRRIGRPSVATRASCCKAFVTPRPQDVNGTSDSANRGQQTDAADDQRGRSCRS